MLSLLILGFRCVIYRPRHFGRGEAQVQRRCACSGITDDCGGSFAQLFERRSLLFPKHGVLQKNAKAGLLFQDVSNTFRAS